MPPLPRYRVRPDRIRLTLQSDSDLVIFLHSLVLTLTFAEQGAARCNAYSMAHGAHGLLFGASGQLVYLRQQRA